jgi:uncharacterized protein YcbX
MGGESVTEAFMGFSGFYGDRSYAFKNSEARKGFPYLTARLQQQMLGYRPQFRYPERAAKPPNLAEAMSIAPGVTPANGEPEDMILDIITPAGMTVAVDDPALVEMLGEGIGENNKLKLVHSDRPFVDCRPISLISLQSVRQVEQELGAPVDKRRFRANIYLDLTSGYGFAENEFVGRKLRVGPSAVITILERDPRCKMISLDPDTGEHEPEVLRHVARAHEGYAGVYCAVLVEGVLTKGDLVELVD